MVFEFLRGDKLLEMNGIYFFGGNLTEGSYKWKIYFQAALNIFKIL